MKHRPFSELTRHWPLARTAKIEARVESALAELERQERERAPDEGPPQVRAAPSSLARPREPTTR